MEFGRPRAILVVDPIDGTRPAAAGLESCCVSVAVVPPSRDATLGDVEFGVVHEIKTRRPVLRDARRRRARRARRRSRDAAAPFRQHRSRARCSGPPGCAAVRSLPMSIVLEDAHRRLVDARRLLRPRLGDVQHDADRHRPARRVRRHRPARSSTSSPSSKPRFRARRATARSARTSRTTSRPPRSIVAGGGRRRHRGRRRVARRPPGRRLGRRLRPRGARERLAGAARPAARRRSSAGMTRLRATWLRRRRDTERPVRTMPGGPPYGRSPRGRRHHHHRDRRADRARASSSMYNGLVRLRNRDRPRVVADRRAAQAPARPDPEPGRDGQGLRRPRDARRSKRSSQAAQRGDRRPGRRARSSRPRPRTC